MDKTNESFASLLRQESSNITISEVRGDEAYKLIEATHRYRPSGIVTTMHVRNEVDLNVK